MGAYKSIKFGAWMPQHGGLVRPNSRQPITLQPRLLNGTSGAAGEFEFEWDAIKLESLGFSYGAIGGRFATGTNYPFTAARNGQAVTFGDVRLLNGAGLPNFRLGINNGIELLYQQVKLNSSSF